MMTAPATITVQIDPFCNCDGCIHKVKKALRKVDDVKFLAMDPGVGTFTISTTKHPEIVKYFLKKAFPNKNITVSQKMNRSYPVSATPDVDDIAKALVTMSQVKGLESVEYTQTTVYKLNFINPDKQPTLSSLPHTLWDSNDVHLEYAPHLVPETSIRPSAPPIPTNRDLVYGYPPAPPIPTTPNLVYGYPPEFYGFENHPHGNCTIL